MKDLAAQEKQQVSLDEKRKHANSKAKKLKKSLQDVSFMKHKSTVQPNQTTRMNMPAAMPCVRSKRTPQRSSERKPNSRSWKNRSHRKRTYLSRYVIA